MDRVGLRSRTSTSVALKGTISMKSPDSRRIHASELLDRQRSHRRTLSKMVEHLIKS